MHNKNAVLNPPKFINLMLISNITNNTIEWDYF